MATSIHIPKHLLEAIDRRAKALDVSRSRLIVRALERELGEGRDWSPGFFERLGPVDAEVAETADALLATVVSARSSKAPPKP